MDRLPKRAEKMKRMISLILIFGMLAVILNACTQTKSNLNNEPIINPNPKETPVSAPQPSPEVPKETPKADPIQEANDTSGLDQSLKDLDEVE